MQRKIYLPVIIFLAAIFMLGNGLGINYNSMMCKLNSYSIKQLILTDDVYQDKNLYFVVDYSICKIRRPSPVEMIINKGISILPFRGNC